MRGGNSSWPVPRFARSRKSVGELNFDPKLRSWRRILIDDIGCRFLRAGWSGLADGFGQLVGCEATEQDGFLSGDRSERYARQANRQPDRS